MIDNLGAASTNGAVQCPIGIQCKQICEVAVTANFGLLSIQALAGILDHLPIGWDRLARKNTIPVDFGTPDDQLEASELWVEFWFGDEIRSHEMLHFNERCRQEIKAKRGQPKSLP